MPPRLAVTRVLQLALAGLIVLSLAGGCDAERDLEAYFDSPLPDRTAAVGASPSASPNPSPASPSPLPASPPPPSPSPSPSPTLSASPTPAPTETAGGIPPTQPTGTPSPTRPPSLPAFSVLRERANVVDYDRLLAQPARYEGELLFFEGPVVRVRDDGRGNYRARIRISGGQFIHLVYEAHSYWGQPLVEGDRIRVVGYFRGLSDRATDGERVPVIEVYDLHIRFT